MLYREIIALCAEIHTKHVELLNVKLGGTYSNHWAVRVNIEQRTTEGRPISSETETCASKGCRIQLSIVDASYPIPFCHHTVLSTSLHLRRLHTVSAAETAS
jgi:hypothetical protein